MDVSTGNGKLGGNETRGVCGADVCADRGMWKKMCVCVNVCVPTSMLIDVCCNGIEGANVRV